MPTRQKFFSDEERRAHKAAVARLKVYLKTQFHRWREFRAKNGFSTDDQVAKFLLDWYESSQAQVVLGSQIEDSNSPLMSISNRLNNPTLEGTPWTGTVAHADWNSTASTSLSTVLPSAPLHSAATPTLVHPCETTRLSGSPVSMLPLTASGHVSPLLLQQMPPPSVPLPRFNPGVRMMKPSTSNNFYFPFSPLGLYQGFGRIRSVAPMQMSMAGSSTVAPTTGSFMPTNQMAQPPPIPTLAAMRAMGLPYQSFAGTMPTVLSTAVPPFGQADSHKDAASSHDNRDGKLETTVVTHSSTTKTSPMVCVQNTTYGRSTPDMNNANAISMPFEIDSGTLDTNPNVCKENAPQGTTTACTAVERNQTAVTAVVQNPAASYSSLESAATGDGDMSVELCATANSSVSDNHAHQTTKLDNTSQTPVTANSPCSVATVSASSESPAIIGKHMETRSCDPVLTTSSTADQNVDASEGESSSVSHADVPSTGVSVLSIASESHTLDTMNSSAKNSEKAAADALPKSVTDFQGAPHRRLCKYGLKASYRKLRKEEPDLCSATMTSKPKTILENQNLAANPRTLGNAFEHSTRSHYETDQCPLDLKINKIQGEPSVRGRPFISCTSKISDLQKRRKFIKECGLKIKIFMGKIVSQAVRSVHKLGPPDSQAAKKTLSRSFLASAIAKQLRKPLLSDDKMVDINNNSMAPNMGDTIENKDESVVPDVETMPTCDPSSRVAGHNISGRENYEDLSLDNTEHLISDDTQELALDLSTRKQGKLNNEDNIPVGVNEVVTNNGEAGCGDNVLHLQDELLDVYDIHNRKFICDRLRWAGVAMDPEADLELACGGVYIEKVTQDALASSLGLCRKDLFMLKRKCTGDDNTYDRKSKGKCLHTHVQNVSRFTSPVTMNPFSRQPLLTKQVEVDDKLTVKEPTATVTTENAPLVSTLLVKKKKRVKQPCPLCPRMFHNNALPNHLKKHAADQQHACMHCGDHLVDEQSAKEHLNTHHKQSQPDYGCKVCPAKFWLEDNLIKHVNLLHTKIGKRECWLCWKLFSDHHSLKQHIDSVHEKIRRRACSWPGCAKRFKTKHHLDQHLRLHTGEKPYGCALCNYSAAQQNSLNYHMRTRHHSSPIQLRTRHGIIMRQGPITRQCIMTLKKKNGQRRKRIECSSIEAREMATRHMLEAIDAVAQGIDDVHPKERIEFADPVTDTSSPDSTCELQSNHDMESGEEEVCHLQNVSLTSDDLMEHGAQCENKMEEDGDTASENHDDTHKDTVEGLQTSGEGHGLVEEKDVLSSPTRCDEQAAPTNMHATVGESMTDTPLQENLSSVTVEETLTAMDLSKTGRSRPQEGCNELTTGDIETTHLSNEMTCAKEMSPFTNNSQKLREAIPGNEISACDSCIISQIANRDMQLDIPSEHDVAKGEEKMMKANSTVSQIDQAFINPEETNVHCFDPACDVNELELESSPGVAIEMDKGQEKGRNVGKEVVNATTESGLGVTGILHEIPTDIKSNPVKQSNPEQQSPIEAGPMKKENKLNEDCIDYSTSKIDDGMLDNVPENKLDANTSVLVAKDVNETSSECDKYVNTFAYISDEQIDKQVRSAEDLISSEMVISNTNNNEKWVSSATEIDDNQGVMTSTDSSITSQESTFQQTDCNSSKDYMNADVPPDPTTDMSQQFDILALAMNEVRSTPATENKEECFSGDSSRKSDEPHADFQHSASTIGTSNVNIIDHDISKKSLPVFPLDAPYPLQEIRNTQQDLALDADSQRVGNIQSVGSTLCTNFKRDYVGDISLCTDTPLASQDSFGSLTSNSTAKMQFSNSQDQSRVHDSTFKLAGTVNFTCERTSLPNVITNETPKVSSAAHPYPGALSCAHYAQSPQQSARPYSGITRYSNTFNSPYSTQPVRFICYPARRPWANVGPCFGDAFNRPQHIPSRSPISFASNTAPLLSTNQTLPSYPPFTSAPRPMEPFHIQQQKQRVAVVSPQLNVPLKYNSRPFKAASYQPRPRFRSMSPHDFQLHMPRPMRPHHLQNYGHRAPMMGQYAGDPLTGQHAPLRNLPHVEGTRYPYVDPMWSTTNAPETIIQDDETQQGPSSGWSGSSLRPRPGPTLDPMWNVADSAEVQAQKGDVDHNDQTPAQTPDGSDEAKNSGTDIEEWEGLLMQRSAARQW